MSAVAFNYNVEEFINYFEYSSDNSITNIPAQRIDKIANFAKFI